MSNSKTKPSLVLSLLLLACLTMPTLSVMLDDQKAITQITGIEAFQRTVVTTDHLAVFLFCTEKVENCRLVGPFYAQFAEQMKDFVKSYAIICENLDPHSLTMFPICSEENQENLPRIMAYEPPTFKINPYTKQPAKPMEHHYQGNADPREFANFARQHMPAFREAIKTKEALDKFLGDKDIPSKVILFTNKPQTSPLYKSLTSEFRNRILFAEINESSKDLIEEFKITKYPTIVAIKQEEDGTQKRQVYEGDITMTGLRSFCSDYALDEQVEREIVQETPSTEQTNTQQNQKPQQLRLPQLDAANFTDEVNKADRNVLIYLSNGEELPLLKQVVEKFTYFFEYAELNCSVAENADFARDKLNVRNFPALVILPIGKPKRFNARITFAASATLQEVTQDVSDLVGDKLIPISAMEVQGVITTSLTAKKPAFLFLYETEDVSVTYRMMSQIPPYSEHLTFTKLKNPPQEMYKNFEITKLPQLIAVDLHNDGSADSELDPQKVRLSKYSGRFNYEDLSRYFDHFLPEDKRIYTPKVKKNADEVTTQAEFEKFCPADTRVCIIGLIDGYEGTEEAKKKKEEQIATLNVAVKKYPHLPFIYIDTTCHSELLLTLDIQEEAIPTLVVYSPTLKEQSQLVGMFESSTIIAHIERVLQRRAPSSGLRQALTIESRDCPAVHEARIRQESASAGAGGDDDDFLKEFMEEQRRKQEELERELAEGKKKKKKNKKKANDEL